MEKRNSESLIIDLPTKKINGKNCIDLDFVLYLVDFFKDLEKKPENKEVVSSISAKAFEEKVRYIWSDSLATGPMPWKKKENVIGEALFNDFTFDPEKLEAHKDEIYELICMVHHATTYEGMKFLDNGEKWSEIRQPVSFLMALGNALKLVDFKNDRRTWSKEECKNPEITFTLKK